MRSQEKFLSNTLQRKMSKINGKYMSKILIINTIDRNSIELGIYQKDELRCFEFETEKPLDWLPKGARGKQSEDLLPAIDGILKKEKLSLQDINSVLVNQGPGSYTGVRVGVTVANTLGWSLNIPVYGYREGELEKILEKLSTSKISKFSKIVLPYYSK